MLNQNIVLIYRKVDKTVVIFKTKYIWVNEYIQKWRNA